jgi:hypothetical protein
MYFGVLAFQKMWIWVLKLSFKKKKKKRKRDRKKKGDWDEGKTREKQRGSDENNPRLARGKHLIYPGCSKNGLSPINL